MRITISGSVIADLRCEGGLVRDLWDTTVRGLVLRLHPSGRASWLVRTWTGDGRRTSIRLREHAALKTADPRQQETAFRFAEDPAGGVAAFWWVDRGFGYAVTAKADGAVLLRAAEAMHRHFEGS